MKTTYRRMNGFDIEIAGSGESANSRVILFRHARLTPQQYDLVEQAPGTRCLLIGGEETKAELRRALKEIGRPQLAKYPDSDISGRTHHRLLAYLGLSSSGN